MLIGLVCNVVAICIDEPIVTVLHVLIFETLKNILKQFQKYLTDTRASIFFFLLLVRIGTNWTVEIWLTYAIVVIRVFNGLSVKWNVGSVVGRHISRARIVRVSRVETVRAIIVIFIVFLAWLDKFESNYYFSFISNFFPFLLIQVNAFLERSTGWVIKLIIM